MAVEVFKTCRWKVIYDKTCSINVHLVVFYVSIKYMRIFNQGNRLTMGSPAVHCLNVKWQLAFYHSCIYS